MKSLNEIGTHRTMLSGAFELSDSERKAAKTRASEFFEKLCLDFAELSAPERSLIRKQLNQELVKFLLTARHIESMDLKGSVANKLETSISRTARAGTSLSTFGIRHRMI
jgi:hypothetical protein